jgi:hypothetical protein
MRVLLVTTGPVELLEADMSVSGVVRIVRSVRAIADMCNVTITDWKRAMLCFPGITELAEPYAKTDAFVLIDTDTVHAGIQGNTSWNTQEPL